MKTAFRSEDDHLTDPTYPRKMWGAKRGEWVSCEGCSVQFKPSKESFRLAIDGEYRSLECYCSLECVCRDHGLPKDFFDRAQAQAA